MLIENCVYINLDARTDRKEYVENLLQSCPYNYSRIAGVVTDAVDQYNIVNPNKNRYNNKGILGCFLAHKNTVEYLLTQVKNWDAYSIVLEDDVYIHDRLWPVLADVELRDIDTDIFFVDCLAKTFFPYALFPLRKKTYPLVFENFKGALKQFRRYAPAPAWGTQFLIIPNKKLQHIYDTLHTATRVHLIDMFYLYQSDLHCCFLETGLSYQNKKKFTSDINY